MKESLYIIVDGVKNQVDILKPSGITLNFKSNIFGDISKVTCSHSYTFRLPNTNHNANIFDLLDDVRYDSSAFGKRFDAEYYQEGVQMFENANLYVSEIANGQYNAVLTWDVAKALQVLIDSDKALNQLEEGKDVQRVWRSGNLFEGERKFDNTMYDVEPVYNAGVMYRSFTALDNSQVQDGEEVVPIMEYISTMGAAWRGFGTTFKDAIPLPCVPVHRLLTMINKEFGTDFQITKELKGVELKDPKNGVSNLLNFGVIPLVSTLLDEETSKEYGESIVLKSLPDGMSNGQPKYEKDLYIESDTFKRAEFIPVMDKARLRGIKCGSLGSVKAKLRGVMRVKTLNNITGLYFEVYMPRMTYGYETFSEEDVLTVSPTMYVKESDGYTAIFNFSEEDGFEPLDIGALYTKKGKTYYPREIRFRFNIQTGVLNSQDLKICPYYDEGITEHFISINQNLPDISCIDFVKSLFFIAGGFPKVEADGSIGMTYYNDIAKNIDNGNVYDWSDRLVVKKGENMKMTVGSLAQRNVYKMKSDDEKEDTYAKGDGVLMCNNKTLSPSVDTYTAPYYASLLKRKGVGYATGDGTSYWSMDKEEGEDFTKKKFDYMEVKASKAKPVYGLLCYINERAISSSEDKEVDYEPW